MQYLVTIISIFSLFAIWMVINQIAKSYAEKHPDLGDFKEEGGGCGKSCGCSGTSKCKNKHKISPDQLN